MALIALLTLFSAKAEAGNEKTIALVMKSLSNPFFTKMEIGARSYAEEKGISLEVFGIERETDVERQIGIVESLISRKYGAIVIAPADSKELIPVCLKALEHGITVINIDNPLHRPTMADAGISIPFIGPDNYEGAKMVGSYIRKKLKGKGQVMIVEGIRGAESAGMRKRGFIDAVTTDSEIDVVFSQSANWHTDEALSLFIEYFQEHKQIDAVFCANDAMALGVLQALEILDPSTKTLIAGYDNIDSIRTEIRNGRIHATIEQHPGIMGEYGVEAAWNKLNGIETSSLRTTPLDLITYEPFGKKVVLSVSTLSNSFFSILAQEAAKIAELFGIEFILLDAGNEDTKQFADIMKGLSQKIDLLIINPTNSETISPVIEFANSSEIPVITVDRKVSNGEVLSHIECDNEQGGKMAASFLAEQLGGNGNIVEIEGIPGTSAAYERGKGFNTEIANFEDIRIVFRESGGFDKESAKKVMLRLIDENQPIHGIFAHNDSMILGAIDAYAEKEMPVPQILVGFDAIPEAREAMRKAKLTATISQKPEEMGKLAIKTAAAFFRDEPINHQNRVPLTLVTE